MMGIWIEFRCENRFNNSSMGTIRNGLEERCESHDNDGPMEMAGDTQQSVIETIRDLEKMARKNGWEKTRHGWICAYCAKLPGVKKELDDMNASL